MPEQQADNLNTSRHSIERSALISALQCYVDFGVSDFCSSEPSSMQEWDSGNQLMSPRKLPRPAMPSMAPIHAPPIEDDVNSASTPLGTAEAIAQAETALKDATSLEGLKAAIQEFKGLSIQKTAQNIVFSEGNPKAALMIISDTPGASEDSEGHPFAGINRKILQLGLNAIDLDIEAEDVEKSVYTASLMNWRPPGGRTPQDGELAVSRLFLRKHIELAAPKTILLLGNLTAKTMLECKTNMNKLRGNWQSLRIDQDEAKPPIEVMPSFHPLTMQKSPLQKKGFWADLLAVKQKIS